MCVFELMTMMMMSHQPNPEDLVNHGSSLYSTCFFQEVLIYLTSLKQFQNGTDYSETRIIRDRTVVAFKSIQESQPRKG